MSKKGLAAAVATTAVGGAVAKRLLDHTRGEEPDPRSGERNGESPRAPEQVRPGAGATGPSRRELYEEARRLGIPGRSKMNKRQLQEAVAARQGRR